MFIFYLDYYSDFIINYYIKCKYFCLKREGLIACVY